MAAIFTTNNGAQFFVTNTDDEYGNVMVSIPENNGGMVWAIADWFHEGPRITRTNKTDRFAAKFTDVYVDDVDSLRHYLNRAFA